MRRAAVVTVSDGVAAGTREDASGDAVAGLLETSGFQVSERVVIPDETEDIVTTIRRLCDEVPLVVTTGGTGLGPRDVTPEATRRVAERDVPGLAEAMRAAGRENTPFADLSRGVVAARGETLVVNLPGSTAGATESLAAVIDVLDHALDLLAGQTRHGEQTDHAGSDHDHEHGDHEHEHDRGPQRMPTDVTAALADRIRDGQPSVLATVTRVEGDPPSATGHKLLLGPDGPIAGTLGCSDFDALATADTAGALEADRPLARTYDHDLGAVEVLLEPHVSPPRLVAGGATPVATWMLVLAGDLGWRTALLEPRSERITTEHRAVAGEILMDPDDAAFGPDDYVVHTDHDAPEAADVLAAALLGDSGFVGIMGSRRHTAPHVEALRERGFSDDEIDRIESPVGIKLGSSDKDIALGIVAGLVLHRNQS